MNPVIQEITDRITERSQATRAVYLARIRRDGEAARAKGPARAHLGCANLAHGFAAAPAADKPLLMGTAKPGVAIVTSYN
ncbi:MAG TPA: phosphogluconate dehydratase, partial [Nonomuraea sp.]|nr:phosphogluconate dehydratase [Nonomuraea sp.]